MFLARVCNALTDHKIPFAIVGGHAVALRGDVRGTVDIGFVIQWSQENLVKTEQAVKELGLLSRLPVTAKDIFEKRDEYIVKPNLIAWNFYNPQSLDEQLDLVINYDLGHNKPTILKAGDTDIPVLDVQRLIAMKRDSGRPQDLLDAEALESGKWKADEHGRCCAVS